MTRIGKVAVYAVSDLGLLVFDEPDFPEVQSQVPGGTIEPGEAPQFAARREFEEETGITVPPLDFLGRETVLPDGAMAKVVVERHFFYGWIAEPLPDTWDHWEMDPSDGSDPVLYRYRWVSLGRARSELVPVLQSFLHLIPQGR